MNDARASASAPHRPIAFAPARVSARDDSCRRHDPPHLAGRSRRLRAEPRAAVSRGREAQPARIFLQERTDDGWRKLTYAEARPTVDALATALIARGLSAQRPVMILSANAIDHALLMLAGYTAGIPVAPISVAYSLQSQDFAKLKHIAELLEPGLIYVADTAPFAKALAAIGGNAEIVASRNSANLERVTLFDDLARTSAGTVVENAAASTGAGHDRENPVHFRIDRTAEGRHQHPRHAHGEPAAGAADAGHSSPSSR